MNNNKSREAAYAEFQKLSEQETANGAVTLVLFRLVRSFSTASAEETEDMLSLMQYWSRKGNGEALLQHGGELYYGGYHPGLFVRGGPLFHIGEKNRARVADDPRYQKT